MSDALVIVEVSSIGIKMEWLDEYNGLLGIRGWFTEFRIELELARGRKPYSFIFEQFLLEVVLDALMEDTDWYPILEMDSDLDDLDEILPDGLLASG